MKCDPCCADPYQEIAFLYASLDSSAWMDKGHRSIVKESGIQWRQRMSCDGNFNEFFSSKTLCNAEEEESIEVFFSRDGVEEGTGWFQ